jgi:hypothetical protein
MAQGLVGSDAYLEAFHWGEVEERPDDPDAIVAAITSEFGG